MLGVRWRVPGVLSQKFGENGLLVGRAFSQPRHGRNAAAPGVSPKALT